MYSDKNREKSRESSIFTPSSSPLPEFNFLQLIHSWDCNDSIISSVIAKSKQLLICGTQNGKILIFDLTTYRLIKTVWEEEMQGSNLCLVLSNDEQFILVGGSESLIKVYNINDLNNIRCIKLIYSSIDIGDIFSIHLCEEIGILFIGAQNASLLWCFIDLEILNGGDNDSEEPVITMNRDNLPHLRYNKFFDSKGPGGRINHGPKRDLKFIDSISLCELDNNNSINFAHYGYIYNIAVFSNEFMELKFPEYKKFLVSCGGDGSVKIWGITNHSNEDGKNHKNVSLKELRILHNDESILSMYIHNTYLYVGLSNGIINTWDLLTSQLIKSFKSQNDEEISCLVVLDNNSIIFGNKYGLNLILSNGSISKINNNSTLTLYLNEERDKDKSNLITGGTKVINYYDLLDCNTSNYHQHYFTNSNNNLNNDTLIKNLSKFVSFRTVSKFNDIYLHDLRSCTKFLIKLFDDFGATSHLVPVENGNPIIISTFKRNKIIDDISDSSPVNRILYYGHYDVVEANGATDDWTTTPFEMISKNGFLYGRGVSDNKGPTLANIQAVAEIYQAGELNVDVVFVIEGEEETGSKLFKSKILNHLNLIGDIDFIFSSNSYWLDDERPCLNYGLRGVVNATIELESEKPDRHSGVDGGVLPEPMMDLIKLLSTFNQSPFPLESPISINEFYKDIKPLDPNELDNFTKIVSYNPEKFKLDELISKWTRPSLTIHKIEVSGPNNNTVIPQKVKCSISIRLVPNQNLEDIKSKLINHLQTHFKLLETNNRLKLNIFHEAEPWLGDRFSKIYKIAFEKISSNWGVEPLLIREGGSIPIIRFLEKTFNATACQVPCGQSSDNAHLKNERLRIINLLKLKDIFKDILIDLGKKNDSTQN